MKHWNHSQTLAARPRAGYLIIALLALALLACHAQPLQPEVLFNFPRGPANPVASLVQGSDGNFYGTTTSGGSSNVGTIFQVTTNGTLTTLVSFNNDNGANPYAGLALGRDGNFYGTTYYGGSSDYGTVFKVTTNGALTTLDSFNSTNGANPYSGLTLGSDGNFYGTTSRGGSSDYGTVFKVTTNGALTTLVSFNSSDGENDSGLTLGSDGNFYGTTSGGTVFKVTTNGTLSTLVSFNYADGGSPGGLTLGGDGNFYGTTSNGGSSGYGTVFKVTTNGILTTFASFDLINGTGPTAGLALGSDGNFYGTTSQGGSGGLGTIFQVTTNGTLTALVSFYGYNGGNPRAGLTLGSDGNFYGTTYQGGSSSEDGSSGYGTVFKVTTNGTLTTLVSFSNANGANPSAGLALGSAGNFYGTTSQGGSSVYGTVFKMRTNGALTTLVSFYGYNGANPQAALTLGNDGSFYGTTSQGGSSGYGTVFKVTTNGTLTTLVSFNGANGSNPQAGLTLGGDGDSYGTTSYGGSGGYGTVFKVATHGTLTTLVSFNSTNGANPYSGLTLGGDGNFYGTTSGGGSSGKGTVFQMTTNGTLTTLVSFNGANGSNPQAGLTLGGDGNFYGTTSGGGSWFGTIFQVTINGTLATLVSFNGANGSNPQAGLTLGGDGKFYGTTSEGGSDGLGTVFRLSPLVPLIFSQPQPTSQAVPVGVNVTISAGVFGAPPLSYQWTLNTTNLLGQTNASLTLSQVSLSDSGTYALLVTNSLGNASSSNAMLTVLPAVVTTLPVSGISATGAVLNGSVTLGPNETLARFEWGTDTNYGQIDGVTDIPGGSGTVTFTNALSGLDGDLIYHYRVVAWNSFGIAYGTDQSCQVGLKPTAVTLAATGITTNSAALNATVNPGGRRTTVWFKWGTTTSYGNLTPVTSVGSGSASLNFSNVIAGLSLNTNYHCRVVASNGLGQVTGGDVTFMFGAALAVTDWATAITGTNAWINGRVTPNLFATTAWFEWGTNTSYGSTVMLGDVGSGNAAFSVSNLLNSLDPTVTYHFRLVASNSAGIAFGADAPISTSLNDYAQSVLADQPLVYYRFDEPSGAVALNSGVLGSAANGTYNATVSLANLSLVPALGYAAGFNNTNSGVAVPALGTYSQITIEAWAKPHTFGVSSSGQSHTAYNSIYTMDNWVLGALHTHLLNNGSTLHQYEVAINGNSPTAVDVGNSGLFPVNSWVHLAATYDSAARKTITYVNGHPLGTNTYSYAIPVNLAAAHIGEWTGVANWFDGGLDEFAIYGTVLPASRIQAHYQAAIGNPVLLSAQTTNKLTFSWIGPGFRLQRNPNLSNASGWTNVLGGSNSPVSVTISNTGNQFFRLKWP